MSTDSALGGGKLPIKGAAGTLALATPLRWRGTGTALFGAMGMGADMMFSDCMSNTQLLE